MRILVPLLKASAIAALVFAISWIRFPQVALTLRIAGGVLMEFGIPIVIMGLVVGFPIAVVMSKCRILRWWSATSVGTVVGGLLSFLFSYGAWRGPDPDGIQNPHTLTFSPVHWPAPGETGLIRFTLEDLIASIALGALTGAALGLSFWFFHSRAMGISRSECRKSDDGGP